MVSRPEVLAIVQARGGSKGLPRKNVRPLCGHPLVAFSIASGLASRAITRVIISTDDEEIAEVARQYGAEVPFVRPADLAADDTPDFPLFDHALRWLSERESYSPDLVVQLRPTTPLRPRGMLDEAIQIILDDPRADCVRGITIPKQTPYKMWRDGKAGYVVPLMETEFSEPFNMPRQMLPVTYWQTGHVDVIRTSTILEKRSLTGSNVRPIIIDGNYCVDIDTLADFDLAERAIEQKQLQIDVPRSLTGEHHQRAWPTDIELIVFDFDGVFTDNRVLVFEDGREAVLCSRGDGMGISLLRNRDVQLLVLSTEANPVVLARCRKLNLECIHGLDDKSIALKSHAARHGIPLEHVVYVGNDVNDLACMNAVGFAVAVADAHPTVLAQADLVLEQRGGFGAVRELCDLILKRLIRNE